MKTKVLLILSIMITASLFSNSVFSKELIDLQPIGTYATGIFAEGAAEIVAHDPATQRLFVTNGYDKTIDVIDISDPTSPSLASVIDLTQYGKQANSVDVYNGLVVCAVENVNKQAPGTAVFFDTDGNFINQVTVGALPDMITFSPNGDWVLVANEGEPNDDYTVDPVGSVSIIDIRLGAAGITQDNVKTAGFERFNNMELDSSIRIFGPNASVAQDLEPEYITVDRNSQRAWVTLQENNALGVINIKDAKVEELIGLGFKDHSLAENGFDASNEDNAINITPWPTYGMFQPDTIASYRYMGQTYIVTANEGDSRDYAGFSEEERVKDVVLDPTAFPDAEVLQQRAMLGRLKITTANGDFDGDGDFDALFSYGARSFSILNADGQRVYDSADEVEQITASILPEFFNSDEDDNDSFDARSDDKGPEPEGLALGKVYGRTYAFIGLERIGGIMVYDITNPSAPSFVQYLNTRDFSGNPELSTAGDLAPEGLAFINDEDSPTGNPLLVVSYEVSGTTTIFEISKQTAANTGM